jgi:hypothetical protein
MNDEQTTQTTTAQAEPQATTGSQETRPASGENWQEVGRQFQALGQSLAAALRTTWAEEEERGRLQALQTGLKSMVHDVDTAIKEQAVPQVKQEVTKAAHTAKAAGRQAAQEARPHVLSALRQLNDELQKMIARMEQAQTTTPQPETPAPGDGAATSEAPAEPVAKA